jgi:hypothetical protein
MYIINKAAGAICMTIQVKNSTTHKSISNISKVLSEGPMTECFATARRWKSPAAGGGGAPHKESPSLYFHLQFLFYGSAKLERYGNFLKC